MSRAETVLTLIGSVGAALAAVLYTGRQLRRLVRKIDSYIALPQEVISLNATVATNTQAIGNLSEALNRLTKLAEDRASGGSS